jgi:alcohol dehydrogenase class IV
MIRIPQRSEVVFGEGAVAALPGLVRGLDADAAFVVSDPGLAAAGVTPRVLSLLGHAGIRCELFDGIGVNPTVDAVRAAAAALHGFGPAAVVAIGGGSPIDAAKAAALSSATGSPPPIVAVPTTAGTGTETNGFGVIEDVAARRKRYLGDASTVPRHAILDPALTVTVPPHVTAACGIDVLAHAIESLQSRAGNAYAAALALEAARLVAVHLPRAVADGADIAARSALLLAAHLAGLAFSTTGLGAAHAIGHALSARHGTPHGVALAAVLPLVAAHNLPHRPAETARLAQALGAPDAGAVPDAVAELQERVGVRPTLADLGATQDDLPALADTAAADEVIRNAPRTYSRSELAALLEAAQPTLTAAV